MITVPACYIFHCFNESTSRICLPNSETESAQAVPLVLRIAVYAYHISRKKKRPFLHAALEWLKYPPKYAGVPVLACFLLIW
jgi:hypothetical protein